MGVIINDFEVLVEGTPQGGGPETTTGTQGAGQQVALRPEEVERLLRAAEAYRARVTAD